MAARFVLHPVLLNKKSRHIFYWFLAVALLVGGLIYWRFNTILKDIGVYGTTVNGDFNWFLTVLLSPHFKYSLVLGAAVLAGSLTAHHVVGPVRRIENWVRDWEAGRSVGELRVRKGDKFSSFVRMVNELRQKLTPSKDL